MNKKILLLCVVVGMIIGVVYNRYSIVFKSANYETNKPEESRAEVINDEHLYSSPKTIIIPKLNLQTSIESVGLDNQGRMDVPKDPNNVGWYNLGTVPGSVGSAVIDGHLDTKTGPAVFYKLNTLSRGDVIKIIDDKNQTAEFTVTGKISYNDDNFPIDTVFSKNDTQRLNLITCDGVFNKQKQNYSNRLVVFSVLKK
jgi:sortase (surface protein transpeptidase)